MTSPQKNKEPTEKEIAKRRDETLKRMLKTPPKPHSEMAVKKPLTKSAQRNKQGGPTAKQDHPEES